MLGLLRRRHPRAVLALDTRARCMRVRFAFIAAISTVHYFRYAYPALMLLTTGDCGTHSRPCTGTRHDDSSFVA